MWRNPGKSYEIEYGDKKICCLPLSRKNRAEFLRVLYALKDTDDSDTQSVMDAVDRVYDLAIKQTETISGVDDVAEFLDCQDMGVIIGLVNAMIRGGSLSEDEEKN